MNTIDNLRQDKLAGSLSNNTIIGTKNPLDQIIIENLKNILNKYIGIIIFDFLRPTHIKMNTVLILGALKLSHYLRYMLIRAILLQSTHIYLV
jgi:hypothetical protein